MLAVACAADALPPLPAGVEVAAYNAPRQTVLTGPVDAVLAVEERLRAGRVAHSRLATSHAFHSAMTTGRCCRRRSTRPVARRSRR